MLGKFGKMMHFLHLDFLGFGEMHRPYNMVVMSGGFYQLLRADGEEETEALVLDDFHRYYETVTGPLEDGSYNLDYDVAAREFHGLGTKHKPYRVVRRGEDYYLYDMGGTEVDEDDPLYDKLFDLMNTLNMQDEDIPEGEDGVQIDLNESSGAFRGFEGFGGGDSGGGGASDQLPVDEGRPATTPEVEDANAGAGIIRQDGDGQNGGDQGNGPDKEGETADEAVVTTTAAEPEAVVPAENEVVAEVVEPESAAEPASDPEPATESDTSSGSDQTD